MARRRKPKLMKIRKWDLAFLLFTFLFIGFVLGTQLSPLYKDRIVTRQEVIYLPTNTSANGISVEMPIVAVAGDGEGVIGKLVTTAKPGTGLVLVNVNNVLAQYDTQLSGRTAARAASNYTGIDLHDWDIIYTIIVDASVIEGPSAGGAMAVSVAAALQNKTLDDKVAMTGSISEDGTIGPAGGIREKARAAKESGATKFLVPAGLGFDTTTESETVCDVQNGTNYCEVGHNEIKVSIGDEIGLDVIEIDNIAEAVGHFIGD